jgi:hypothetical protein
LDVFPTKSAYGDAPLQPDCVYDLVVDINLTNTDLMCSRGFTSAVRGFLDTIRDGHPSTPLLVISPILCSIQENTSGPLVPDQGVDTGELA